MTTTNERTSRLTFQVIGTEAPLTLRDFRTVVAGYTARDEASVRKHIEELAEIGVPEPESVPAFYPVDSSLVTQDDEVVVDGGNTSGEVEPVLVRIDEQLYLGVGSDHTDRDIERTSIPSSKAACPKPLSRRLVPLSPAAVAETWDSIGATSTVDGDLYQEGTLAGLRPTTEILALHAELFGDDGGDLVIFGGTLPLINGTFVAGTDWTVSLELPDGTRIDHTYRVTRSA